MLSPTAHLHNASRKMQKKLRFCDLLLAIKNSKFKDLYRVFACLIGRMLIYNVFITHTHYLVFFSRDFDIENHISD